MDKIKTIFEKFLLLIKQNCLLLALLIIIWNIFNTYKIVELKDHLKILSQLYIQYSDDLATLKRSNQGLIDLSTPIFQRIGGQGNDFIASIGSVDHHLNGLKIKGFIINSSSVAHTDANFNINISDQTQNFMVKNLYPGRKGTFEVFIPNIANIDRVRYGYINYLDSMVSYY